MKKQSIWATILMAATIAASLFFSPAANAATTEAQPTGEAQPAAYWHYYQYYQYLSQCKAEVDYLVDNGYYAAAECRVDQPVYDLYVWY